MEIGINNGQHSKMRVERGEHNFQYNQFRKNNSIRGKQEYQEGKSNFHPSKILEKFGVDNVMKIPEVVEKVMINKTKTLYEKHGVAHNWSIPGVMEDIMVKTEKTMIERYGVKRLNQLPEQKEILRQEWEINNPMFKQENRIKRDQTLIEKYGVDNPMKNVKISKKAMETRRKNELSKEKTVWYKNEITNQSVRVRKNSYQEKLLLDLGFIPGRGIKGYTAFRFIY